MGEETDRPDDELVEKRLKKGVMFCMMSTMGARGHRTQGS